MFHNEALYETRDATFDTSTDLIISISNHVVVLSPPCVLILI